MNQNDIDTAEIKQASLQETLRINALISAAQQEVNGMLAGITNVTAIFNESPEIQEKFLSTDPLTGAMLSNSVGVVKFLKKMGVSDKEWHKIRDEEWRKNSSDDIIWWLWWYSKI